MATGDHGIDPLLLEDYTDGRVLAGDSRAGLLLDLAAGIVVSAMGWTPWPSRTETMVLDSPGTRVLTLPTTLVTDVTEVVVDDDVLPHDRYRWSAVGLLECTGPGVWPAGYRRVRVTVTHGVDTVPDDVLGVVLGLAGRLAVTGLGLIGRRAGGVSENYLPNGSAYLLDADRQVLARYSIKGGGRGV